MKIYKLGDEVRKENEPEKKKLIITDIRQGVKNPNRANIFINEKFSFSLDISQVAEFKIKIGLEISEEDLVEFQNASVFGKLYQRTLEWVLVRPRSEKDVRDYLTKKFKQSSSDTLEAVTSYAVGERPSLWSSEDMFELSSSIISRLKEKKYLDDFRFAEWYVENRFVKKGISRKRLRLELVKKGVPNEIIDKVLNKRNDEEEILKIITKKRAKYDDKKLTQYLCRQGFDYQLAQSLVQDFEKD